MIRQIMVPSPNILDALPHRSPFRFLTSVSALEFESFAEGSWHLDGTEYFFAGHFPDRPTVPGVLIVESLAQLSGLIAYLGAIQCKVDPGSNERLSLGKLAHVDVRFKKTVVPPAEVLLRSRMVGRNGAFRHFEVEARNDGRVAACGRLILAGSEGWAMPTEASCPPL